MVYADSLNSISAPGFNFSADGRRVTEFQNSIDTVAALRCDVLLTPHPEMMDIVAMSEGRTRDPKFNPVTDRNACKAYAAGARERLAKRLAEERAAR
jgi:metallo-beta-lactamase class B